jgi:hypothetical protein
MFMGVLLFTYYLHTDSREEGVTLRSRWASDNSYQTYMMYQSLYDPDSIERVELSSPYKCADCALNLHSLLLLPPDSKMDSKRGLSLCSHLDLRLVGPVVDACFCKSRRSTMRSEPWICLPSSCSRIESHRPLVCLDRPRCWQ